MLRQPLVHSGGAASSLNAPPSTRCCCCRCNPLNCCSGIRTEQTGCFATARSPPAQSSRFASSSTAPAATTGKCDEGGRARTRDAATSSSTLQEVESSSIHCRNSRGSPLTSVTGSKRNHLPAITASEGSRPLCSAVAIGPRIRLRGRYSEHRIHITIAIQITVFTVGLGYLLGVRRPGLDTSSSRLTRSIKLCTS